MAIDTEGKGEGGNESEEPDLIGEILGVVESVAQFGDYRRTQRKECHNLVRRMKLLLPLIEEIRDLGTPIPEKGMAWLQNLKDALVLAKKVLQLCNEGSKIQLVSVFHNFLGLHFFFFFLMLKNSDMLGFQALEGEVAMVKFQKVYERLGQAFDGLPCELGTSDEVKEQVGPFSFLTS